MQKDLTAVMHAIELQLKKHGLDWAHVLYIHLYISDMKQFGLANEVYLRFITEKKCYLGVPSRSTIELPITEVGLGNAYVEVLVSKDLCKRVLHVQSMSCWAPCCIGPYSQATLHKELLYMAGQLGLDPPTMLLHPDGPAAEMDQALLNCEAVANCFRCSVSSSAITVTVYCSSVSSFELTEIQNRMDNFLKHTLLNEGLRRASSPIVLYVLVTNLPKGAHVEVKPVLHCTEDGKYEVDPVLLKTYEPCVSDNSSFKNIEWLNTCCNINVVPEKICAALIYVTKDHAAIICREGDENVEIVFRGTSHEHVKAIALFFIHLIDRIISDNGFSWQHLKNLRFYVLKDLVAAADVLFSVFSEAFFEFAESSKKVEANKEPIFNLVPVLCSGRSSSMDSLITCELYASKL
ncbi:hypothetical protein HPP92_028113 [Vanilla planifolia]|uniref:Uncharacterized protein n=1 Tax=Vanilla planifolia TaxID=51239 RepID=A0A835P991_VANPL|nr:hypothetical protein HPP92_028113 [Vanilla planifolia]